MQINWAAVVEKLPELGMAILLVWYTLRLLKYYTENRKQEQASHEARIDDIMETWRKFLKEKDADLQVHLRERDDKFVAALVQVTDANKETNENIVEELKKVSIQLDNINSKTDQILGKLNNS